VKATRLITILPLMVMTLLLAFAFASEVEAQTCVPPPSGLVSWWPGDGNAEDIVGGNDGTLVGGTSFVPGKVGQAFSFDGIDDGVDIPITATNGLDITDEPITIDFWYKPPNVIPIGKIFTLIKASKVPPDAPFEKYAIDTANAGTLLINGRIRFIDRNGSLTVLRQLITSASLQLGNFNHIAATVDGNGKGAIYLNGVAQTSFVVKTENPGDRTLAAPILTIGYTKGSDRFAEGLIDEVEIFNRALSPQEIQAIFNAGSAGKCKPEEVWLKEPGVRVDVGPSGALDSVALRGPDVISLPSGGFRMYYVGFDDGGTQRVLSATSSDGFLWTKEVGVRLVPGGTDGTTGILQPEVAQVSGGTFRMYYMGLIPGCCWKIFSAVSSDGLSWVKESGVRIAPGPLGFIHAGSPEIVQLAGGTLRMYFTLSNSGGTTAGPIFSATSSDGVNWTLDAGTRLPAPGGNESGLDARHFGHSIRELPSGTLRMYYNGFAPDLSVGRVFSALSSDGLTWASEPGIRIDLGGRPDGFDDVSVVTPDVHVIDGALRMYYSGFNGTQVRILSAALTLPNLSLEAVAGIDQSVHPGDLVTLTGSGSDPDGNTPLTFAWELTATPVGSTAALADSNTATPSFTPDLLGDYTVQLVVTDSLGASSAPDTLVVSTFNTSPTARSGAKPL